MKTFILLTFLTLLAYTGAQVDPASDDAAFLASLLGEVPADGQTNQESFGAGGGQKTAKPKCGSTSDIDSLTSEQFLALLSGDCDPVEPEPEPQEPVQLCERGEFQCTPYHRCREEDIYSDGMGDFSVRIGLAQYERERDYIQHSECPRFGDVCCSNPLPVQPSTPRPPEPYTPQCGRRNQDGLGVRIAGFRDSETQFGEFPWVVVVLQIQEVGGEQRLTFVCAGSLVHPQVVLTAAHSVNDMADARLVVRLGEWDTQHESELYLHEDYDVSSIKIHPQFHARLLRDDVAMLVLNQPVPLQSHIDTLCLPDPAVNYDRAACVTAGWGKDALEDGQFQTVLKKVDLPHVPRAQCQRMLRKTPQLGRYFRLDRSFTCAGGNEGEDACKGDGGAPLACRDPQQPDRWVQIGVVSWGVGCGVSGVPGVYADVRPHVGWISETISEVEREQQQDIDLSIFERRLTGPPV
ncbi:phenoloxidase-activating factor 2-like [Amphibalanus amphitrite]|uniref:phenoloxidase-activating factor 2-like n=1 Tax=Amphibalanus amphitrite TaxID=1232801 RepID=UPI001C91E8A9|nr:phenoloxidase-activating factor 2-like [Amphibalanus amphitrite]